jgi:hypothetical protein
LEGEERSDNAVLLHCYNTPSLPLPSHVGSSPIRSSAVSQTDGNSSPRPAAAACISPSGLRTGNNGWSKTQLFRNPIAACGCVQFLNCASSIGPLCLRQHGWDYFFFCAAAQHSDHQKGLAHQEGAYFSLALKAFLCFFVCVGVGCSFLPNIDDSDTGSRCGKYEAAVLRSTFRLFVSSPQKPCFCVSPFFRFLKHELQGLCTMKTKAWSVKRGASASRMPRFVVVFASLARAFSEYVTGRQVRNIRRCSYSKLM